MGEPQRKYLSIDEVAEHVGVHRDTVIRWIEAGTLQAYKLGPRLYRIDICDLDAFIRAGRTEEPA